MLCNFLSKDKKLQPGVEGLEPSVPVLETGRLPVNGHPQKNFFHRKNFFEAPLKRGDLLSTFYSQIFSTEKIFLKPRFSGAIYSQLSTFKIFLKPC